MEEKQDIKGKCISMPALEAVGGLVLARIPEFSDYRAGEVHVDFGTLGAPADNLLNA